MSEESPSAELSTKLEFDDADIDDGLDPAMKEELDRCYYHFLMFYNKLVP